MRSTYRHQHFFDTHAQDWDSDETSEKIDRLHSILKEMDFLNAGKILDVGCGTGILIPILKRLFGKIPLLVEFDLSRCMIDKNKERCSLDYQKIFRLQGDAHKLPFSENAFQNIMGFAVYPHLSDKKTALSEFHRVLTKGGHVFILHLMGSRILNQFHQKIGQEVNNDRLKPVDAVSNEMKKIGFDIKNAEENDDLYLIVAKKLY